MTPKDPNELHRLADDGCPHVIELGDDVQDDLAEACEFAGISQERSHDQD